MSSEKRNHLMIAAGPDRRATREAHARLLHELIMSQRHWQ